MAISKNHLVILSLIFINLVVPLHSMEPRLTDEQKSQLLTYSASIMFEKRIKARMNASTYAMTFSPRSQKLILGSGLGIVELDLKTEQITKLDPQLQFHSYYAYSPDYTKVALLPRSSSDVLVGDSLENIEKIHTRFSEKSGIVSMAFSSDNKLFACGLANNSVVVRNLETNERTVISQDSVCPKDGNHYPIYSLTFSPDGMWLASGSKNGPLLWDIANRTCCNLFDELKPVKNVAFRPQTKQLVSGSFDGTLRFWDLETKKQVRSFNLGRFITSLVFSPDGMYLISSDSVYLMVSNLQTGRQTRFNAETYETRAFVALSPDGYDFATCSGNLITIRDLRGFYELSKKLENDDISDEELVLFKKYAHNPQFHPVMKYEKLCQELGEAEGSRKFRELKHAEGQQWGKFQNIITSYNSYFVEKFPGSF